MNCHHFDAPARQLTSHFFDMQWLEQLEERRIPVRLFPFFFFACICTCRYVAKFNYLTFSFLHLHVVATTIATDASGTVMEDITMMVSLLCFGGGDGRRRRWWKRACRGALACMTFLMLLQATTTVRATRAASSTSTSVSN